MSRAGLWAWFLFESGLGAQRAKELLATWQSHTWSLRDALGRASSDPARLGLTPAEARQLTPPGLPPVVDALLWDDALYPAGLGRLPIRLRPALLFYEGDASLLRRPMVYLVPAQLGSEDTERLREVLNLLIGEDLLFAAYSGTPQSELLLEELAYGQGEALLFVPAGLKAGTITGLGVPLMEDNRLLLLSPLPAATPYRPALDAILQQVAAAAADRMILSGDAARRPADTVGLAGTPALAVSEPAAGTVVPANVHLATAPTHALAWVSPGLPWGESVEGDFEPPKEGSAPVRSASTQQEDDAEAYDLHKADLGPPPTAEEIIDTLSHGGRIPEVLRRRLADKGDT